jgi:hypothetical protein
MRLAWHGSDGVDMARLRSATPPSPTRPEHSRGQSESTEEQSPVVNCSNGMTSFAVVVVG